MDVIEGIMTRRSTRDFKPDPIPRNTLEEILEICRWTPSWANTQSWEFAIVGGTVIEELKNRLEKKCRDEAPECPDIPMPRFRDPYSTRKTGLRDSIDKYQFPAGTKALEEKRHDFLIKGARFHNAPNAVILYLEKDLAPYLIYDAGAMVQNICLAAHARGLGTCPTIRVVLYPDVLREVLAIPENKIFIIGIDIGYPAPGAPVNSFPRTRVPLSELARWYGV